MAFGDTGLTRDGEAQKQKSRTRTARKPSTNPDLAAAPVLPDSGLDPVGGVPSPRNEGMIGP
jgi:hypothetical protein